MAIQDPRPPTRRDLARIFGDDQRLIRAFEKLFDLVPQKLNQEEQSTEEVEVAASIATAKANEALGVLTKPRVDYIDFNGDTPHAGIPARVSWGNDDDTLNVHHAGGVTNQVGLETYLRGANNTGTQIDNGECVGFGGVDANGLIEVSPFLADGSFPPLYIIGVATQDIPDGAVGRVTVWGRVRDVDTTGTPFGETWVAGDILYASPTTAGGLTNIKPTAPDTVIPIAAVLIVDATAGQVQVRPTESQQLHYGAFTKTADQTLSAVNTAEAITFDTEENALGVRIDATVASRIVADNAGLYAFNASFQLTSTNSSVKDVHLWFRKNGADQSNTTMIVSLESASAVAAPSRSLFFSLLAGDYIELMWASDSVAVTLDSRAATAFSPTVPACILTVEQIQQ